MAAKFVLHEKVKEGFQFTFQAPDGQVILSSPFFADKEHAIYRINAMRSLARRDKNLGVFNTEDGQFYIVLKDNKDQLLGQSGIFADELSLQRAIATLKRCIRAARISELARPERAAHSSKPLHSLGKVPKRKTEFSRMILTQTVTGQYSFSLRARDGQLLLTSPFYPDKVTALGRIESTRMFARGDSNYEVRHAGGGQYYFELKNNHRELLGRSTVYSDLRTVQEGIDKLKKCTRETRLLDLSGS